MLTLSWSLAAETVGHGGGLRLNDHSKLKASAILGERNSREAIQPLSKDCLWNDVKVCPNPSFIDIEGQRSEDSTRQDLPGGDSGDRPESLDNSTHMRPSSHGSTDSSGSSVVFPEMNVHSPMEILKKIWRSLITIPPNAVQLEQILKGSISGYDIHSVQTLDPRSPSQNINGPFVSPSSLVVAESTDQPILNSTLLSNQFPLRANGTHQESLYRQILSQFLDPLASEGKRSLWLDQELALKLKGSVVIAHHPELWRQIGDGLKPQLNRGIRLLTPSNAIESPGNCSGVTIMFNI